MLPAPKQLFQSPRIWDIGSMELDLQIYLWNLSSPYKIPKLDVKTDIYYQKEVVVLAGTKQSTRITTFEQPRPIKQFLTNLLKNVHSLVLTNKQQT